MKTLRKETLVNKYNIQIIGNKKYIASSLEQAKKMAEKDIGMIHYLWNAQVNGYMDLGEVGSDNG